MYQTQLQSIIVLSTKCSTQHFEYRHDHVMLMHTCTHKYLIQIRAVANCDQSRVWSWLLSVSLLCFFYCGLRLHSIVDMATVLYLLLSLAHCWVVLGDHVTLTPQCDPSNFTAVPIPHLPVIPDQFMITAERVEFIKNISVFLTEQFRWCLQ